MHAIADDSTTVAYQVTGEGPVLMLLAGQANSHRWWGPVRDGLGAGRRTVTLDWRGTGGSGPTDRALSTRRLAGDVAAVLDDLRVERADVYGTSMGGRVAQWFAIDHVSVEGDPSMTPQAQRDHLRASDGHDSWDRLPDVLAPTLVLHGADDEMAPAVNARLLGERITGSRVELLPGLRHAYFHEGESVATPLVREFLGDPA